MKMKKTIKTGTLLGTDSALRKVPRPSPLTFGLCSISALLLSTSPASAAAKTTSPAGTPININIQVTGNSSQSPVSSQEHPGAQPLAPQTQAKPRSLPPVVAAPLAKKVIVSAPKRLASARKTNVAPSPLASTGMAEASGSSRDFVSAHVETRQESGTALSNSLAATFRVEFYGPSFTDNPSLRPDLTTGIPNNEKDPVHTENKLTLGYRPSANTLLGVGLESNFYAIKGFQMRDPYLLMRDKKLIHSGGFNVDAQLRSYLGMTGYSQDHHLLASFRLINDMSFHPSGTRWTFTAYTYAHQYVYGSATAGNLDQRVFAMPMIEYQMTSNLSAVLAYKAWANHTSGSLPFAFNSEPTLLAPGLSWTALPGLNINPYLDLSPGTGFAYDNTTIGLNVNWTIL